MNKNYLKPEAKLIKVEAEERIMLDLYSEGNGSYWDSSFEIGDDEEEGH
jgi:hypothetical protein